MNGLVHRLDQCIESRFRQWRSRLSAATSELDAISPLATLNRGYAIAKRLPEGIVLTNADQVQQGIQVSIKLARGSLLCEVERIEDD